MSPFTDTFNILEEEENAIREESERLEKLGVRALKEDFSPCELTGMFLELYDIDFIYVPSNELGAEMQKIAESHGIVECPNRKGLWIYNEELFVFENAEDIIDSNIQKNIKLLSMIKRAEKEYAINEE